MSGALAIEYVKGLQEERVAATVKHYLCNEQDTRRFSVNEIISERALRYGVRSSFHWKALTGMQRNLPQAL